MPRAGQEGMQAKSTRPVGLNTALTTKLLTSGLCSEEAGWDLCSKVILHHFKYDFFLKSHQVKVLSKMTCNRNMYICEEGENEMGVVGVQSKVIECVWLAGY